MVSLKHVYEIAKIKQQDPPLQLLPLETICKLVVRSAHTIGIKVVPHLDPVEYGKFLQERKALNEQQLQELKDKKAAKLLRTG